MSATIVSPKTKKPEDSNGAAFIAGVLCGAALLILLATVARPLFAPIPHAVDCPICKQPAILEEIGEQCSGYRCERTHMHSRCRIFGWVIEADEDWVAVP